MMDKLLSVVIPVYNTERYLRKCLNSLIVPEHMDKLEVLVIIDGSPDNSLSIAQEYETSYPGTFRVIAKENGGHGSCCNVGLKEAKGKYIRFLDSDDWFDHIDFPKFMKSIEDIDADLIQTNFCYEIKKKGQTKKIEIYKELPVTDVKGYKFNPDNYFITIHCSTFRTIGLRESNIFFSEKTMYDDTSLYVQPFLTIRSIKTLELCVYHYYIGRSGQSVSIVSEKAINNKKQAYSKLLDEYNILRKQLPNNVVKYLDSIINFYILKDYYKACIVYYDLMNIYNILYQWTKLISNYEFILPKLKKVNKFKIFSDWLINKIKLSVKRLFNI